MWARLFRKKAKIRGHSSKSQGNVTRLRKDLENVQKENRLKSNNEKAKKFNLTYAAVRANLNSEDIFIRSSLTELLSELKTRSIRNKNQVLTNYVSVHPLHACAALHLRSE